jgi:hypothetical protein
VKARARRAAQAARFRDATSFVSDEPAITTPSLGDRQQSGSQLRRKPTSAKQVATSQAEAAPPLAYVGLPDAGISSTASGEGHGESLSVPNKKPFLWASATAAEISQHCRLGGMPLNLIEQVLPRFRVSFLQDSKHPSTAGLCNIGLVQVSAPVVRGAALGLRKKSYQPGVDGSELLPTAQHLASFSSPEPPASSPSRAPNTGVQASLAAPTGAIPDSGSTMDIPEWWNMMDGFTWAPETEPPTAEEHTAHLQQQGSAVLEQTIEEGPSAMSEYLLGFEHSHAMEAGWGAREDVEKSSWTGPPLSNTHSSTELAQRGTGTNGICAGDFDFGHLLDGWEGWAELGCPDKL